MIQNGNKQPIEEKAMSSPVCRKISKPLTILLMATIMLGTGLAQASDMTSNPLEGFKEIKVAPGYAKADSLIGTILPFVQDHPENDESIGKMDIRVRQSGSGYQVTIIKDGYLDDSIRGEHFLGHVIYTSNGRWELLSMHVKPLCYRGMTETGLCR